MSRKIIPPYLSVLVTPVFTLLIVVLLFIIMVSKGYSQVKMELANLKTATEDEKLLKTNLDKLKEVSPEVGDGSSAVVVALPDKNHGLLVISHLRKLSPSDSLVFKKVELRNVTKVNEDMNKMEILGEFDISDYRSVVSFLKNIMSSAPISSLDKFRVNTTKENGLEAELTISTYWASLPTKLPDLTQPFKELSAEDQELLSKVSNLTQPEFTVLPPTDPSQRVNPFN